MKALETEQRERLIRDIAISSMRPCQDIHPVVYTKATNGQWYSFDNCPHGAEYTDEKRTTYCYFDGRAYYGEQYKTEAEARNRWNACQKRNADEFTEAMEAMSDDDIRSQAEYWLHVEVK